MRGWLAPAIALVAACRGNDAAIDAGGPDAAPIDGSGPRVSLATGVAGAHVYFLNADSSVVLATTTANDGTASAAMAAGGSVTVVAPVAAMQTIVISTFAEVQPGDQLQLELGPIATQPMTISFDVTYPLADGATGYELRTSCGTVELPLQGSATDVTLSNCGGTADLVLVALGSGAVIGAIAVADQAVADGQALAISGSYVAPSAATYAYANVPAAVAAIDVSALLVSGRGGAVELFGDDASFAAGSGSASGDLAFVPAAASAGFDRIVDSQIGTLEVVQRGSASDAYALDVATVAVADFATPPAFTGRTLTWTPAATGLAADAVIAVIDSDQPSQANPTLTWQWTLAVSGDQIGAVTFPLPPSDIFDFADALGSAYVAAVDTAVLPGGYATIRAAPFAFAPAQLAGSGSAGTVSVRSAGL